MDWFRERDILMAHVARLNENNIVTEVIVVSNDYEPNVEQFATELFGGNWKQTSFNSNFRGIFAGIGYLYLEDEDIFVMPQPYESWLRNGSIWEPPLPQPTDHEFYIWNESDGGWLDVS
jgi:hypothetical protein